MDYKVENKEDKIFPKIYHFLQDIWPGIYKTFNSLLFGLLAFIRDTISGLWRKW